MKSAGSSIELALAKHCGEKDILTGDSDHKDISHFNPRNNLFNFHAHTPPCLFFENFKNESYLNDYFKFTIVRNPWEAMVSYYWFSFVKSGKYTLGQSFKEIKDHFTSWISMESLYNWPKSNKPSLTKQEIFDFLVFLSVRDSQYTKKQVLDFIRQGRLNPSISGVSDHFGSQRGKYWKRTTLEYLSDVNGKFYDDKIDYVIKFERLEEDYKKICNLIQIPYERLPYIKHGYKKINIPYSEYYNEETKKMIEDCFRQIIVKFGYRFGN